MLRENTFSGLDGTAETRVVLQSQDRPTYKDIQ